MQFDLINGTVYNPASLAVLPAIIFAIVSVVGVLCVWSERKKARGHWADQRKYR